MPLYRRCSMVLCLAAVCLSGCRLFNFRVAEKNAQQLPRAFVFTISSQDLPTLNSIVVSRSVIWVVGQNGALIRSDDEGASWSDRAIANEELIRIGKTPNETLVAVGRHGLIVRSRDNGATWDTISVRSTADLFDVFSAGNSSWIVGDQGTVLRSQDDGATWSPLKAPNNTVLRTITGSADGTRLYIGSLAKQILASGDGGKSWKALFEASDPIQRIHTSSNGNLVIAVGDRGSISRSADAGSTWTQINSGVVGQLADVLSLSRSSELWISGADGVLLRSQDEGLTWKRIILPTNRGMLAIGESRGGKLILAGWTKTILIQDQVGSFNTTVHDAATWKMKGIVYTRRLGLLTFGQGGVLLASQSQARRWQQLNLPLDVEVRSACETPLAVWVAGTHGMIASSTEGNTWNVVPGLPDVFINTISCSVNGKILVAGANGGVVFVSVDSGRTWSSSVPSYAVDVNASMIRGKYAYLTGSRGMFLKADLSDFKWKAVDTGSEDANLAIVGSTSGKDLWIFSRNGGVLFSHDFGQTWGSADNNISDDFMTAACVSDCKTVIAAGEHGTVAQFTGGPDQTWSYTAKTRFDIHGITFDQFRHPFVLASDFTIFHPENLQQPWQTSELGSANAGAADANGTSIWASGDVGKLWHSSDAGQTWSSLNPLRLGENVLGIACDSLCLRIWAVGSAGRILSSSDGGKSWEKRQVGIRSLNGVRKIGDALWAVGDFGTLLKSDGRIESWSAVSQDQGSQGLQDIAGDQSGQRLWAVGAAGAILHSQDGGRSWLRQPSRVKVSLFSVLVLPDGASVIAVGDSGTVAVSHDGGLRWRSFSLTGQTLRTVALSAYTNQVWAAGIGGATFISDDFGETWNEVTTGTTNDIYQLVPARNGTAFYAVGDVGSFETFRVLREKYHAEVPSLNRHVDHLDAQVTLEGLPSNPTPVFTVRALRQSEINKTSAIEVAAESSASSNTNGGWLSTFDLSSLNPHVGESFALELCFHQNRYERCLPLPAVMVEPWIDFKRDKGWLIPSSLLVGILVLLTVLLFASPLTILAIYQRAIIYEAIEKSSIPGAKLIATLLKGTILPFFALHPRTTSAWVRRNHAAIESDWRHVTSGMSAKQTSGRYIALPVESSGQTITSPSATNVLEFLDRGSVVQILGPGGIGKTVLLLQLGVWIMLSYSSSSRSRHTMPVAIGKEFENPEEYLQKKLETISGSAVPLELVRALLKNRNLLIFVDNLSELDPADRLVFVQKLLRFNTSHIVLSSRDAIGLDPLPSLELRPKPLDSGTLLLFITATLSDLPEEKRAFNTMELQLEIGNRIVRMLDSPRKDILLTPLLVKLYIDRAIDILARGAEFDQLPHDLAGAYVEFILSILRSNDFADESAALEALKTIARLVVGRNFIPGKVQWKAAEEALQNAREHVPSLILDRLMKAGLIAVDRNGLELMLQFVLDPLAEYCAAFAYAQECGFDLSKWEDLARKLNSWKSLATGFQTALESVAKSYAEQGICSPLAIKILREDGPSVEPGAELKDETIRG